MNKVDFEQQRILAGRGLYRTYGQREVVRDVSLEVQRGEVVGLLGPNGAGKTTTFYMLTGMIRPTAGKIGLNGEDITQMPMYLRARKGIGYLSQEPSVFTRLTVEENLRLVLQMSDFSEEEQEERLEKLLEELHIAHLRKSKATTLSGGERRRTEIARSLVLDPSFMLLDEPFAGVDPIAVEEIQNIVVQLRERGIGVLITDHNVRETLSITDRAYLLYDGALMKSGSAEELASDEETRRLYLGRSFKLERQRT
ncbi:MAG: LPS export ABC transporter ATP-binding protein [Fidelibacterota bacterium]|nr:MAG: LPS export ABC transporter ATP-binding protein [Candidatus Neomarinimicrobiota bacterium]